MTTLEWAYEFRDAPDLERAGEALTRKLESFVVAGPPATARDLTDRQTFEAVVAAFIAYRNVRLPKARSAARSAPRLSVAVPAVYGFSGAAWPVELIFLAPNPG